MSGARAGLVNSGDWSMPYVHRYFGGSAGIEHRDRYETRLLLPIPDQTILRKTLLCLFEQQLLVVVSTQGIRSCTLSCCVS
jgi:hypothetical protein